MAGPKAKISLWLVMMIGVASAQSSPVTVFVRDRPILGGTSVTVVPSGRKMLQAANPSLPEQRGPAAVRAPGPTAPAPQAAQVLGSPSPGGAPAGGAPASPTPAPGAPSGAPVGVNVAVGPFGGAPAPGGTTVSTAPSGQGTTVTVAAPAGTRVNVYRGWHGYWADVIRACLAHWHGYSYDGRRRA